MKSKLIALLSALLASLFIFNLVGCTKRVSAQNLLDGVTPQAVEGLEADEEFVLSQMQFSVNLFKGSVNQEKNQNTLISPLSIMIALALAANGADGETLAQMESVLGMSIDKLNEYLYSYASALPNNEYGSVSLANSVWMKEDEYLEVKNDYLQTVANYYDADIFSAPFDDKTLKDMNNWVNNKTDGLIKNALDRINEDAILYLINTLLFEADWPSVYERSDVLNGTFTAKNGEEQSAKMMRSTEWKYIEPENATGFVKNYKNRGYSFVGILPNEGVDINEYIASLNASDLLAQLEKPYGYETKVRLPKFEYDFSVNLNNVLKNMGMTDAFDWRLADFSKMATYNLPTYNVYIGNVLHQTSITVAEKGTRAGAVTVIEMMKDGSVAPSEIIKYVYLDRPFVYMIIDSQTKLPIFIGHVENL